MATRRARYVDLAHYLATSGRTQADLADAVGTTQGHVSRIARGHLVPRPELAQAIARRARIPLDSFVRVHLAWRHEDDHGRA